MRGVVRAGLGGAVALFLVALFVGWAGLAPQPDRAHESKGKEISAATRLGDVPPLLSHDGPCLGTRLSIPKATTDLRVAAPVLVPRAPEASFANLDSLWRCDDGSFVATFGSGVEVVAQPGWDKLPNASSWWGGYLATNGYGKASTVHGVPGVVEDPDADHRGLAQAILQGWMIIVLGNTTLSGEQLNSIAGTM